MKELINKALKWILARNFRERMMVLLIACFVTLLLWLIIFAKPMWRTQEGIEKQINDARGQIDTLISENNAILQAATQLPTSQFIAKSKGLKLKTTDLKQRLEDMIPRMISVEEFQKIMNALLNKDDNVEIVSLKQLPSSEWTPAGLQDLHLPVNSAKIYKHGVTIQFHGTYFNTMTYLSRLENLPWRIYWERMDYHVLNYPEADVTVTFFILSNQKS